MAIEPFQRKVGLDPRPARDYSLPGVIDVGASIGRFGKHLQAAFEPSLRKQAEEEAAKAAGSAEIVRSSDGSWVRPERPKGAGLVYAEAFDRAMDQRYLTRVQVDIDNDLGKLALDHKQDPEAYRAAATGYAEGLLEKVDERHRGVIDTYLARELSERYRGLAGEKHTRDLNNTIEGLKAGIQLHQQRSLAIAKAGGAEAERLATEEYEKVRPLYQSLKDLGAINQQAADAMVDLGFIAEKDELDKAGAFPTAVALAGSLEQMSDEELSYVVGSAQAPSIELTAPESWKHGKIRDILPSDDTKRQLGSLASDVLNRRAAERAEAAAKLRAEEERRAREQALATNSEILAQLKKGNYLPEYGYSEGDIAGFEASLQQRGNLNQRMGSPAGRQQELAFIGTTGYVPQGMKEYVEGMARSGNIGKVAEFLNNLRNTTAGKGRYAVGETFWQSLSQGTRAAYHAEALGRRLGLDPANVQEMVRKVAVGEGILDPSEARSKIGNNYTNRRAGQLMDALGVKGEQNGFKAIDTNPLITRDFDNALPYFMLMFPGDTNMAMTETAKAVANAYRPNKMFEGGFAPVVFERTGIGPYQINQLPHVTDRRLNPTGARAGESTADGRSRVLIAPINANQQAGYGKYRLTFLSKDGRVQGGATVDFDAQFKSGGIPQQPGPPPIDRSAQGKWMVVYDRSGRFLGYRDRNYVRKHPGEFWQGKTDKMGKPILGGR